MALKVEIININKNADNILLVDNLTIELVKIRYNWLLNANVKNAVVGENSNGLVWYSGEWLCGDWEGGTWYSGIWHSGNWKKGDWFSYLLDKSMILVGKFIILDRNEKYSEFRNGNWYTGNWYDGTFGDYNMIISGKTINDINGNSINTSIWKNGEWYNGIFQNSIWFHGNFYNGYMHKSYWIDGHFHKGIFNRYEWFNGLWYGGDFLEGIWDNGKFQKVNKDIPSRFGLHTQSEAETSNSPITIWRDGEFYDGEFHSGLNIDPSGNTLPSKNHSLTQWINGTFNGGNWYGGSFVRGIFNGGNWYGGVFNAIENVNMNPLLIPKITECIWNDGNWYNGLWINGIWKGGHFYNGMWLFGQFKGKYLSTNKIESELILEEIEKIYLPSVTTDNVDSIGQTEATAYATVNNDGGSTIIQRGIYWFSQSGFTFDKTSLPPDNVNYDFTSGSLGQYSIRITDLAEGTTYYYGSYVINLTGFSYGEEKSFKTLNPIIGMPVISINSLSSISSSKVNINYQLNYIGNGNVFRRGICWGTTLNPISGITNTININENTSLGVYQSLVTGLTQLTNYYFRAYAENDTHLAYSESQFIKTPIYQPPHEPILNISILNIGFDSFTVFLNITDVGEGIILNKGICWTLDPNVDPIYNNNTIYENSENLSFQVFATGLTQGSTYYVRGFSINDIGTGYTNKLSITLNQLLKPTITNISINPISGIEYGFECSGIINKNNSDIILMGFDYSGLTSYGRKISTLIPNGGFYSDNILSLNPGENYYIRGFAINSIGTGYSITISGKTMGSSIPASISLYENPITNDVYQIGTRNNVFVNISTTKNGETIFKNMSLYVENSYYQGWTAQDFSQQNPIFSTNFYIEPKGDLMMGTYSHTPNSGGSYEISSSIKAEGKFGFPEYVKSSTIFKFSVYPILYFINNSIYPNNLYFSNGTFYNDCVSANQVYSLRRQSLMTFQIKIPENSVNSSRTCHIGYYYKYGDLIKMSLNGLNYPLLNNIRYLTLKAPASTIYKPNNIINYWYVWYNIISIDISAPNFTPGSFVELKLYFNV